MNVYLTFDVEVWCGGWLNLDSRFPSAFERYVYGRSRTGDYALPAILEILVQNGLKATFFVEPLFAARFGQPWLDTIVKLIVGGGQDVQLHLHTEWTDEISPAVFPGPKIKRQHLSCYSLDEQMTLVALGKKLLKTAGCDSIKAFRAGSFAANRDTYKALAANDINIDSSLNFCLEESGVDLRDEYDLRIPSSIDGVFVLPMTVFADGFGHYRPAQIGSCSFQEMKAALQSAHAQDIANFVILSHNFEMLKPNSNAPDYIVISRFKRLCEFLSREQETYQCLFFDGEIKKTSSLGVSTFPRVSASATLWRYAEQALRRLPG